MSLFFLFKFQCLINYANFISRAKECPFPQSFYYFTTTKLTDFEEKKSHDQAYVRFKKISFLW